MPIEDAYRERVSEVRCPCCKERFDSEKVEFLDISSDFEGKDVMKFTCPCCKTPQESWVTLR